ncbi:MAG: hypothetical protein ACRCSO_07400 [Sphingomonas sp.]
MAPALHPRDRLPLALALLIGLIGLVLTLAAFWPGIMTWDSVRQYDQALSGKFDDWHPPAMEGLWRVLIPIRQGPAPMFLLQVGLYWAGVAALAARAWRTERRWLCVAITALAVMPGSLAIMGAVVKDCLMTGAIMAACGIWWWADGARDRHLGWRLLGIALLVAASTLRFNAFLATVPLGVALLPAAWRATGARLAGVTLAITVMMAAALPVANKVLRAEKSGVELSLVIFDLGGITYYGGTNAFPPLDAVKAPVAANRRCYTPVKWDSYSWWVDPLCPMEFYGIQDWFAENKVNPELYWLRAIAAHPLAYARHRWGHFNVMTRFLVHDEVEVAGQVPDAPNPWHYQVSDNAARRLVNGYAAACSHTPIEWPIMWIGLAAGALAVGTALPSARLIVPLALSSGLYGLGYAAVSVASELRYHLWTMLGAGLASALVAADVASGARLSGNRWLMAYSPVAIITLLAILWRLLPA